MNDPLQAWQALRERRQPAPPLGPVRYDGGRPLSHPLAEAALLDGAADRAADRGDWSRMNVLRDEARATTSAWLREALGAETVLADLDGGFGRAEFDRFWREASDGDQD